MKRLFSKIILVVKMDPAAEVLQNNFKACRSYIKEKIAKVTVSLYKDEIFTGYKKSLDDNSDGKLDIDVKSQEDFDYIKIETYSGLELEREGNCLECVFKCVCFYNSFNSIDVYQYTKDGGCELYSYDFEEEEIEIDIYDDVTRVVVSLSSG